MRTRQLQRDVYTQLIAELARSGVTERELLNVTLQKQKSASNQTDAATLDPLIALETALSLAEDPTLALRLGQRINIESYGRFGFALMSCANLRESTVLLTRYGNLFFRPSWKSQQLDDGLLLSLELISGTAIQQQIIAELCFSQLSTIGNMLTRSRIEGAEVYFKFSKPDHADSYRSMLKAKVRFDADHNELFLPGHVLEMPVARSNRSENVTFQQQCEEMIRSLDRVDETTTVVRNLLIQSAGNFLNISKMASRLNLSERTLRRRLADEATSFRSILDEIRDLLAKEYLVKTQLTVAEIAHLLNYTETVNFRRAFVRLNRIPPAEYRHMKTSAKLAENDSMELARDS